jgi:predicted DNA binding protein
MRTELDVTVQNMESPLQTAMSDCEDVELEIQPSAAHEGTVPPLTRLQAPASSIEAEAIESAFTADPAIDSYQYLTDDSDDTEAMSISDEHATEQRLYYIEWVDDRSVLGQLVEQSGIVTSATLDAGGWHVTLTFPARGDLSTAYEVWETNNWKIYVDRIGADAGEFTETVGLTDEQHQAMERAVELGYYEIPRRITLEELAADLEISHQALSERLRRANRNLIVETVHNPEESTESEERGVEAVDTRGH